MEKKNAYIDNLLANIKSLEEKVITAKEEESIPFSFFRDAFDKTETIMRLLHELENLQIDELRAQMEKLILFLSEAEKNKHSIAKTVEEGLITEMPKEAVKDLYLDEVEKEEVNAVAIPKEQSSNAETEGIVFPQPKRLVRDDVCMKRGKETTIKNGTRIPHTSSLNDRIPTKPGVLDLVKSISLNDRFLFQRELFNNDREAMNALMAILNTFDKYEDAEAYLRRNTSWDFENQTVKDFLYVIRKGFE